MMKWIGMAIAVSVCAGLAMAEPRVVSPLMLGGNQEFREAGLYYGSLPTTHPGSRRAEFIGVLKEVGVGMIRYPGGTDANLFFVDNVEAGKPFPVVWNAIPEGGTEKLTSVWNYLDLCREAGIEPLYQFNMVTYAEGPEVFILTTGDYKGSWWDKPGIVADPSKREAAAKWAGDFVRQVRDRGYRVRHWELGNEEYGGPLVPPKEYADIAVRYARAIREADPEAMIWVTLGDNGLVKPETTFPGWAETLLSELEKTEFRKDRSFGFTLHYSWPSIVDKAAAMVKSHGFKPRFAITEFHMAGNGPYSDLCPRFGYALGLSKYLIEMVPDKRIEIMCIHALCTQNFGIIHYNQKSYGPPNMETWDPTLGYQLMPSAQAYGLFKNLVGGKIVEKVTGGNRLVVRKDGERRIFFVNDGVNWLEVCWDAKVVGHGSKSYEAVSLIPSGSQYEDPLRLDKTTTQNQRGAIVKGKLVMTLPGYSVSYIRCMPKERIQDLEPSSQKAE